MIFTDNRKIVGEINTYEDLVALIDKKSKNNLPFKNYDKVKDFFDDILSRKSIGIKHFIKEWRAFYSEKYPNNGNKHVNYYLIRGYTEEEANEMVSRVQSSINRKGNRPEVIQKRVESWRMNTSKIKTQRGKEFYRLKGLSEGEIDIKIQQRNDKWMKSLDEYVEKTGDDFHKRKGWSYEYMKEKHGHEKAIEIVNARGNPFNNFIKKYGENWKQIYLDTRHSKKNLIKKYGEEKAGELIYQTSRKRILNTRKGKQGISSKLELDFYKTLDDDWKQQMAFKGSNNTVYIFDFYNESTKELIEFQGDYWHCNPSKYDPNYFHGVKKMYAYEIWDFDLEKKHQAEKQGWTVQYVWESDYLQEIKTRIQSDYAIN